MVASGRHLRLVLPHQLFDRQVDGVPDGTTFVLIEHDLFLRQYTFHAQKLVLHRASMDRFSERLEQHGHHVVSLRSDARRSSSQQLAELVRNRNPQRVTCYDVVDDWLSRDLTQALAEGGYSLQARDVLESPNFLTARNDLATWFGDNRARMQDFYEWQRTRLGVLLEPDGSPQGGRWSFDTDNRKKLPRHHQPPPVTPVEPSHQAVQEAVEWVQQEFPDAPGNPQDFLWPTSSEEAWIWFQEFLDTRLADFGPYEDALSTQFPFVYHAAITPVLNIGLIDPQEMVRAVLEHAHHHTVPIESVEGFIRQVIGWREYMRATYHLYGRRMRASNRLGHQRELSSGWWDASTGLAPVDHVIEQVLSSGYAHHIERLMVLGSAMCLLRTHPDQVYRWFMEMFVDAYDWVMVPNVYAMSQFAAGGAITTKPYVSGSNYLRKMSDFRAGDWCGDWDGLYWTFVRDHRSLLESNHRSHMVVKNWERMDSDKRSHHVAAASQWFSEHPGGS